MSQLVGSELAPLVPPDAEPAPGGQRRRRALRPADFLALTLLGIVFILVCVVPFLPAYHPYAQSLGESQLAPFRHSGHLLGTDILGRDTLSRLSLAGRESLLIALSVVALNMTIGVTLGLVAGYFGGFLENAIMGVADLQLAVPTLILLISVIAAVGSGILTLVIVLGVTFWVGYGRVARVIALSLRERDFVLAPVTHGASSVWILRKHLLPNVVPQLAILGAYDLGFIITVEASLSYLGLGIQPPTPSWGGMIAEGQNYLQTDPWLCLLPGAAIFLLVAGVQLLGQRLTAEDRVRDIVATGRL